ncbi:MAG: hypothetical protein WBQ85_20880 [Candidatus Sulfotelmatobacter sp.]
MNNYISPSAESEGSDGSVVFMPQLHRRGIPAAPGFRVLCKILQCEHQKRPPSAERRPIVRMLDQIFANPESSDADSTFLMTDARLSFKMHYKASGTLPLPEILPTRIATRR